MHTSDGEIQPYHHTTHAIQANVPVNPADLNPITDNNLAVMAP